MTATEVAKLDAKTDRVHAELLARLTSVRAEIVHWVVTVGILQTELIAALMLRLAP